MNGAESVSVPNSGHFRYLPMLTVCTLIMMSRGRPNETSPSAGRVSMSMSSTNSSARSIQSNSLIVISTQWCYKPISRESQQLKCTYYIYSNYWTTIITYARRSSEYLPLGGESLNLESEFNFILHSAHINQDPLHRQATGISVGIVNHVTTALGMSYDRGYFCQSSNASTHW